MTNFPVPANLPDRSMRRNIALRTGIVAAIPTQNLLYPVSHDSLPTTSQYHINGQLGFPLNVRFGLLDISSASNDQRHALM